MPTKFGQKLKVESTSGNLIHWKSISNCGKIWFETHFNIGEALKITCNDNSKIALRLLQVLESLQQLNPNIFTRKTGFKITSKLEFPENWGLGSSSTLINNLAQWGRVDAFRLLNLTFGGSGYDIACARSKTAILYKKISGIPLISPVTFKPKFSNQLFFIHQNKKQNSREGIKRYKELSTNNSAAIQKVSELTDAFINCNNLIEFEKLMKEHEQLVSKTIKLKMVQEKYFSDYFGQTKSLGAWGGDFILATGNEDSTNYFNQKGFKTVIPYQDLIL